MFKLSLAIVLVIAYQCECEFDYSQYWPGGKTTGAPIVLECGVGLIPINGDNNGTRDAAPGEVAFQVSLQKKVSGKWAHACGGVVATNGFVLTTASCVGGSNTEAFTRSEAGNVNLTKGGWT
ncbi:unnamed protein product, partial [Medioppia subpectinata]